MSESGGATGGSSASADLSLEEVRALALAAARKRISDPGIAEDTAQEITEEYLSKRSRIRYPERWVVVAAKRQAVRRLEQHHRRGEAHDLAAPAQADRFAWDEGPASMASIESNRVAIEQALAILPEDDRAVLALHYLDGLPMEEVAGRLGITEIAVQKRLQRARSRAKKLWGDDIRVVLQRR